MKKLDAESIWKEHIEPTIEMIDREGAYKTTESMRKAMKALFTKGYDFGFEACLSTIAHGVEDAMLIRMSNKRIARGSYAAKN